MAVALERGPVVVDTDVYSARFLPDSALARRYEPSLVGRVDPSDIANNCELTASVP